MAKKKPRNDAGEIDRSDIFRLVCLVTPPPFDFDPDEQVHCHGIGSGVTLRVAAVIQGESKECCDCPHRRACGRMRMQLESQASFA